LAPRRRDLTTAPPPACPRARPPAVAPPPARARRPPGGPPAVHCAARPGLICPCQRPAPPRSQRHPAPSTRLASASERVM
jgi:hypothetical protein